MHGFSINADEIESKVIAAISCYQNDTEVQSYVESAVKQFSQRIDGVSAQIQARRNDLTKLKERERGLADVLKTMPTDRAKLFLEIQLNEIDSKCQEIEGSSSKRGA